MLTINCSGTPTEVYHRFVPPTPRTEIKNIDIFIRDRSATRSIAFYADLFQEKSALDWPGVCATALKYHPHIAAHYPAYEAEMRGIAAGAGVKYEEILALNVRTEITFGLFSCDGCTALSWPLRDGADGERMLLGQNWDWMRRQKENLIVANIEQEGKPRISMITEAGIIGKIGLNSAGVGVCLNAIRVSGSEFNRTPVHLCLRQILESNSLSEAIAAVLKYGSAASAHMLIADPTSTIGLEVTHKGAIQLQPDIHGRVFHSNHFLETHAGIVDTVWIKDSLSRIKRIKTIADKLGDKPTVEDVRGLFLDEDNYPYSINRAQEMGNHSETLFNILMDLKEREAVVSMGRPSAPEEKLVLSP